MKKIIIVSILVMALLVAGCTAEPPQVQAAEQNLQTEGHAAPDSERPEPPKDAPPQEQETDGQTQNELATDNVPVGSYSVVDTVQTKSYTKQTGEDSDYAGNTPSYTDNGDGTVTDNVTGLIWSQDFYQTDYRGAEGIASSANIGGYTDWRVPTIKELYSLMDFSGAQGRARAESSTPPSDAVPFVDTAYFSFEYPSVNRYIDAQYISATEYVSTTMNGAATFFGVNFADGRIKGYPQQDMRAQNADTRYYLRLVRDNTAYGENNLAANSDGTVSDLATGLMWTQNDSGDDAFVLDLNQFKNQDGSMDWYEALTFAENLEFAGYDDWRLPNAKELHSIVDYTKSPDTTGTAAIDSIFGTTEVTNEAGQRDFAAYWTNTSFEGTDSAVYINFGRGLGYMNSTFMDVHGAGSQRTDPKEGESSYGNGPQGDVRRVYNYVRLVRDVD